MSCLGIFNLLLHLRLLLLIVLIIPLWTFGQSEFSYTKNKWHQVSEGVSLKKMGIYSSYENTFFLKKTEKKPEKVENWVIFGGEGGEFTMYRDINFRYKRGSLLYGQNEISVLLEVGTELIWTLNSTTDTLILRIKQEESDQALCRLFRTIELNDPTTELKRSKEVELMSLTADTEGLKRLELKDLSPEDKRFIPHKIMAIFLSANTLGAKGY